MFDFEKERLLFEAAEACDKAALAKLEIQHNETVSSSISRTFSKFAKSLNNRIGNSLFLYEKNKSKAELSSKNILQPFPKPINSGASEFLQTKTENSQYKSNENIKENAYFKVKNKN